MKAINYLDDPVSSSSDMELSLSKEELLMPIGLLCGTMDLQMFWQTMLLDFPFLKICRLLLCLTFCLLSYNFYDLHASVLLEESYVEFLLRFFRCFKWHFYSPKFQSHIIWFLPIVKSKIIFSVYIYYFIRM